MRKMFGVYAIIAVLCFVASVYLVRPIDSASMSVSGALAPSITPKPVIEVTAQSYKGLVAAGGTFTVGLHFSGDAVVSGRCDSCRLYSKLKSGSMFITAHGDTVVQLFPDGSIEVFGALKNKLSASMNWNNVVAVALGENHLVGLTSKGHVVACGDNSSGQCDVDRVTNIIQIAAGDNHTAMLTDAGKVVVIGDDSQSSVSDWENIKYICAGSDFTAALTNDGSVVSTNDLKIDGDDFSALFAHGDTLIALNSDKTVSGVSENIDLSDISEIDNVEHIAIGDKHIAFMHSDGTVSCIGEDDDLQCETKLWQLRPYLGEDGYVTGFAPKTTFDDAKTCLMMAYGEDFSSIEFKSEYSEYVGTGAEIYKGGLLWGTVAIFGDVNGDGDVTDSDAERIDLHVNGELPLEGVKLFAADTLHYAKNIGKLSQEHSDNIRNFVNGDAVIRQYVYDPYAGRIQKNYNINSDVVGWISIANTEIDYPILYGENFYYHYYTITHRESGVGSIYAFYDGYRKNNVVAGHNARKTGRMFNNLHKVQDLGEELLIYKNRVIGLTIYQEYSEWEIYALYETGARETADTQRNNLKSLDDMTKAQINDWIQGQLDRSEIDLGVNVTADDTLLTMYTCGDVYIPGSDQARLYLFLRRVK